MKNFEDYQVLIACRKCNSILDMSSDVQKGGEKYTEGDERKREEGERKRGRWEEEMMKLTV